MIIYSFYNRETRDFCTATGLSALSRKTGISRNTLVNWFREKKRLHKCDKYICFKSEPVRGDQRIKPPKKEPEKKPNPKDYITGIDLF